jgi:hypothetical protein
MRNPVVQVARPGGEALLKRLQIQSVMKGQRGPKGRKRRKGVNGRRLWRSGSFFVVAAQFRQNRASEVGRFAVLAAQPR